MLYHHHNQEENFNENITNNNEVNSTNKHVKFIN